MTLFLSFLKNWTCEEEHGHPVWRGGNVRHFISRIPSFLFATAAAAYVALQCFVENYINDEKKRGKVHLQIKKPKKPNRLDPVLLRSDLLDSRHFTWFRPWCQRLNLKHKYHNSDKRNCIYWILSWGVSWRWHWFPVYQISVFLTVMSWKSPEIYY